MADFREQLEALLDRYTKKTGDYADQLWVSPVLGKKIRRAAERGYFDPEKVYEKLAKRNRKPGEHVTLIIGDMWLFDCREDLLVNSMEVAHCGGLSETLPKGEDYTFRKSRSPAKQK